MDTMWVLDDPLSSAVHPLSSTLQQMMDVHDEEDDKAADSTPRRAFVRDRRAMARTPADVKELPDAYVFEVDMPGISREKIKVQVDGSLLVIRGKRRREGQRKRKVKDVKEEEQVTGGAPAVKYLRMERRMGRFLRRFPLPVDANTEAITAACKDGVVTVRVEKVPLPEPKKPIQVQVA